jgi:enoyl-CoA hydratase/carnithine racemase
MAPSSRDLILADVKDGYAVITLNRPEKRNAMNVAAQRELCAALDDIKATCRVVVITGAGDISFCAGVDLTERVFGASSTERKHAWGSDSWFETQEAILRHPAVFIAAVNGYALGGGLTLVNNCELAVASDQAQFGMPEMGLGLFPALAGPSTLHRILPKHASQMIFTSERVNAADALHWGLINEVVPAAQLLPRAEELAAHIATFDPVTIDYSKKAVREIPNLDWSRAIDYGIRTGVAVRAHKSTEGADMLPQPEKKIEDK